MKHYKEKCKECNGSGNITVHNGCKPKGDFLIECHLCDGTGFIDWIDKCKGVKNEEWSDGFMVEFHDGMCVKEDGRWVEIFRIS